MTDRTTLSPRLSAGAICADPAKVADFYVRLLGFEVVSDRSWYVHLRHPRSGAELGFLRRGDTSDTAVPEAFTALERPDGVWLSLEVDDLEAVERSLQPLLAQGRATLVLPPTAQQWGETHLLVRDPAGILINICQKAARERTSGSAHRGSREDDQAQLAAIELVISDVDGVMTDGRITLGSDGQEIKHFHVRDGLGIKRWREAGGQFAVITGRASAALEARMKELTISLLRQGVDSKYPVAVALASELGIPPERTAVLGDDVVDLPLFSWSAVSVAPADAMPEVRAAATIVTERVGGAGCVREFLDRLLAARMASADHGSETAARRAAPPVASV